MYPSQEYLVADHPTLVELQMSERPLAALAQVESAKQALMRDGESSPAAVRGSVPRLAVGKLLHLFRIGHAT